MKPLHEHRASTRARKPRQNLVNMVGQVFGNWRVLRRGENSNSGQARWICLCQSCGNEYLVQGANLRQHSTTGCAPCRRKTWPEKAKAKPAHPTHDSEGLPIYGA